jgi:hypothetical protein
MPGAGRCALAKIGTEAISRTNKNLQTLEDLGRGLILRTIIMAIGVIWCDPANIAEFFSWSLFARENQYLTVHSKFNQNSLE